MPDYKQSKIYAIHCLTSGTQYIGSTTNKTLARRLAEHKSDHTRYIKELKKYKMSSFDIIDTGNYQIELIELYPCDTKDELHAREGYFIRTLECINKVVPGRTKTEYYQDNKKQILANRKQYSQDHPEQKTTKNRIYYQNNKEQSKANNRKRYAYQAAAKELRAIDIN